MDALFSDCKEIKVYCPICKTDRGHFNPCNPPVQVHIFSTDTPEMVKAATERALLNGTNQYEGEFEVVGEMQYPTIQESVKKAPKTFAKNFKPIFNMRKELEKIVKKVAKEQKLGENKID